MLYYFGKGQELKKEDCKEYKTLDGARKAFDKAVAAGTEVTVWDENSVVVMGMVDNVPEGALQVNSDGSVNAYDVDGNKIGTVDATTVAAGTGNTGAGDEQQENAETSTGGAEVVTDSGNDIGTGDNQQKNVLESDTVIVSQGTMKVTVICDGTLNLRRSPHWGNTNICGRASRGQSYYVKEIHTVNGKKLVRTIDDIYLSGASEHVQFEQL